MAFLSVPMLWNIMEAISRTLIFGYCIISFSCLFLYVPDFSDCSVNMHPSIWINAVVSTCTLKHLHLVINNKLLSSYLISGTLMWWCSCSSQVAHQVEAYPSLLSMKCLWVLFSNPPQMNWMGCLSISGLLSLPPSPLPTPPPPPPPAQWLSMLFG